jgi:sulfonate transport system ATP-binding protein
MNTARLNPGIPLLLNGVTKRYGDNTILNELDLHIPSGQFVAVVGRSGGGKSTLLRLLAGWKNRTLASCWRAQRRWRRSRTTPG